MQYCVRTRDIRRNLARRTVGLIVLSGLVSYSGCGKGRIPTYAVNGTVTVDGAPAEGAIVVFCPVDPLPEVANLRPAGKTDSSGQFKLTTFDPSDGAPAGQYKILVKWPAATPGNGREDRPGAVNRGPDRLKGKYYNQDTTPLSAKIEKGTNNLPPFSLQAK
jgi:hypothetical protein